MPRALYSFVSATMIAVVFASDADALVVQVVMGVL